MKDKVLASEIMKRFTIEQAARAEFVRGKMKRSDFKKIDRLHTVWMKQAIVNYGLPTYSLVGKKALGAFFMMVRHATQDAVFQKKVLQLLRQKLQKEPRDVPKEEVAYLTDRLLESSGKPTLYGTLYNVKGLTVQSKPIRDAKNVEMRRRRVGILTTVEGRRRALVRELKKRKV